MGVEYLWGSEPRSCYILDPCHDQWERFGTLCIALNRPEDELTESPYCQQGISQLDKDARGASDPEAFQDPA
jgi:hypothetical protein